MYCPGKDISITDVLGRWAYPASQALRDISKHANEIDKLEMEDLILQER